MGGLSTASIGIIKFPCPKCSHPLPVDLAITGKSTIFECASDACDFARALGPSFPDLTAIIAQHVHHDPATIRQRVVDAMSAWFFEWSGPD